ncbi:hypothetical protein QBC35DRAFT_215314 [Podospora australis]|uniref:Uncharacterized protein n=1 Tax=Podospora australis TaxID=1536484 RepID=A0AAN6WXI8_9PEZI|nr:hypothetical protein QBC35DRAFT_215314 [Podospora australis]
MGRTKGWWDMDLLLLRTHTWTCDRLVARQHQLLSFVSQLGNRRRVWSGEVGEISFSDIQIGKQQIGIFSCYENWGMERMRGRMGYHQHQFVGFHAGGRAQHQAGTNSLTSQSRRHDTTNTVSFLCSTTSLLLFDFFLFFDWPREPPWIRTGGTTKGPDKGSELEHHVLRTIFARETAKLTLLSGFSPFTVFFWEKKVSFFFTVKIVSLFTNSERT